MTVQDCIDGLHNSYPQVEDALALTYFRQIHRELLAHAQIETGEEQIDLTQGQREYALDDTDKIVNVRAAYYLKSATDVSKLKAVSTDWFDENKPTWRAVTEQGSPTHFYIEAIDTGIVMLGLDPIPNATTAAGFPHVKVYGTKYQALVTTDEIPDIVPSTRVYIEGMKRLYASDRDPANFDRWDEAYRRELHNALAHINTQIEDLNSPSLVPAWMKNQRIQ